MANSFLESLSATTTRTATATSNLWQFVCLSVFKSVFVTNTQTHFVGKIIRFSLEIQHKPSVNCIQRYLWAKFQHIIETTFLQPLKLLPYWKPTCDLRSPENFHYSKGCKSRASTPVDCKLQIDNSNIDSKNYNEPLNSSRNLSWLFNTSDFAGNNCYNGFSWTLTHIAHFKLHHQSRWLALISKLQQELLNIVKLTFTIIEIIVLVTRAQVSSEIQILQLVQVDHERGRFIWAHSRFQLSYFEHSIYVIAKFRNLAIR